MSVKGKSSLESLQIGRALAALAVLLLHVELTLARPVYLGENIFPIFVPGSSGVPFFFVLSGFVIFLAHHHQLGDPSKIRGFIVKRVRRVYPVLWVVLLALIPFTYFLFPHRFDLESLPAALLILPTNENPWLTAEWTLRHEMLFYTLFIIAIWKPKIGFPILIVWGLASLYDVFTDFKSDILAFYFARIHLLFLFGIGASYMYIHKKITMPRTSLIAGIAIFATTWTLNYYNGDWSDDYFEVFYGLGAALIIMGSARLEQLYEVKLPKFLLFLGTASYSIYLAHFPFVSAMCKIVLMLGDRIPFGNVGKFIIVAAVAFVGSIAFYLWIEKPMMAKVNKWTDRWAR